MVLRPGHLTQGYTTIPVKEYVGKRDLWLNPWDYDKMDSLLQQSKERNRYY